MRSLFGFLLFFIHVALATSAIEEKLVSRDDRRAIETDAAGRPVINESGKNIIYTKDDLESFEAVVDNKKLEKNGVVDPVDSQPLPFAAALSTEESYTLMLNKIWQMSIWGTSIGRTGMIPVDLDGNGQLEIVMASSIKGGYRSNDAWHVIKYNNESKEYVIDWSSPTLDPGVTSINVHDIDGRKKIFVGRSNGVLMVYDGSSLKLDQVLAVTRGSIYKILLNDADNDGASELIVAGGSTIHLLDPVSLSEESQIPYSATDIAIGNVDEDAALEIVLVSGPVIELNGNEAVLEWDFSVFAAGAYLALADLDNDGMEEIISARRWYYIDIYNADNQTQKSQVRADGDIHALTVADVTGDGKDEILYGDGQWGEVHALDAATGTQIWQISNPEHGVTNIAVADTDGDTELEIMWGAGWTSSGEDFFFVHSIPTKEREFKSIDLVGPFVAVDMGDVDGDDVSEIVAISSESNSGYADGVVHIFDSETFALEWRSSTNLFNGFAWTGVHDVEIGDVDGDGITEIIVGTDRLYDGAIYIIDGQTHAIENQFLFDDGSPIYALALEDFDADAIPEIVAGGGKEHTGSPGTYVYVVDGVSGAVKWHTPSLGIGWGSVYAIETADINNDNISDVVAVSNESLFLINGETHEIKTTVYKDYRAITLADSDENGSVEIWAGTKNGALVTIDPSMLTREFIANICVGAVNSVKLEGESARAGLLQFACKDNIGIYDIKENSLLWRSESLGEMVGLANNLKVSAQDGTYLVVGTRQGVVAFQGNTPPVAICQDAIISANNSCQGVVSAESIGTGSIDPDGDPMTFSLSPMGDYLLGDTEVTLTVTDDKGASDTCMAVVRVVDDTPPSLNCPANQIVECAGPQGTAVSFSSVFGDNCRGAITSSCMPPSDSIFPPGDTTDTCVATDNAGNESMCAFNVSVVDTTEPSGTATLVPVGNVDDEEGRFRVEFNCGDLCDPSVNTRADLNGVSVSNGQLVDLEIDDELQVDTNGDVLDIEAPSFTLAVTCTDSSGNTSTVTTMPVFGGL